MVADIMKYRMALWGGLLFLALALFLQGTNAYHFLFIEQNQLFLFSGSYMGERVMVPGGMALLVGEFLVQFFIVPYAGAVITALLLTGVGVLTTLVCKRIAPAFSLCLFYFLPVLSLLFMHFNFNYRIQGTVAFVFLLFFIYLYLSVAVFRYRLLMAVVVVPLLFWWGGPVACLYAFCVFLWEVLNRVRGWYWMLPVVLEAVLIACANVHAAIVSEYKFAFLPDIYFHTRLAAPFCIYFSWISLPVILAGVSLLRGRGPEKKKTQMMVDAMQVLLIIGLSWLSIPVYNNTKSVKLKQLDYYTRTRQWDKVIENCEGRLNNYLYLCYLNMALAEKGMLADKAFTFDQRDVQGLFIPWNKTASASTLLSDVHFTAGTVAIAQEKAFESYVSSLGYGNPRMLQRLVQTNLIYGEYPVAEKYLDILDKTFFYSDWAKEHRKFLYNDAEVEKDAVLGEKRKGLPEANYLSNPDLIEKDLLSVAEQYPANRNAIEYVGVGYLLMKNLSAFENLMNNYYHTDVLPSLPVSFQEAVIILYEANPAIWAHYNVSESIIRRFADFKGLIKTNRENPPVAEAIRLFGDTYWCYFMFK
ncbi:MAG: DUF6057 family protein [Tannerellaceae bacterium]|nr:DUF6057 family protein [Tannerellaceae bacterium]